MKTKTLFPFLLITFSVIIIACKKDKAVPVNNPPQTKTPQQLILGTWNWKWTQPPFSASLLTPDSEGYTKKLKFYESMNMESYKNDTFIFTYPYTLISDSFGLYLTYNSASYLIFLTEDSLTIDESSATNDAPVHLYLKY